EEARSRLFYTLWTLKESFAKALQLELVDALGQCVFWEGEVWGGQMPKEAEWGAIVFQPRPNLFLAAAWVGRPELPQLKQWEWPPQRRGHWPVLAHVRAPSL